MSDKGISIPANLGNGMVRRRQSFVLAVESPDVPAVRAVIERFRDRLYPCPSEDEHDLRWHKEDDCPGPLLVSETIPLPTGGALFIDAGDLPPAFLRLVPDMLRAELEGADIGTASARLVGDSRPRHRVDTAPNAVLLVAVPLQDDADTLRPVPESWAEVGFDWLGDAPKRGFIDGIDVGSVEDASLCAATRMSVAEVRILSGVPAKSFRLFYTSPTFRPFAAFAAGGRGLDREGRIREAESLIDLARRLAPEVGLAFLSFEPDFTRLHSYYRPPHPPIEPAREHGRPFTLLDHDEIVLSAEYVVDGFPYHVLTPAHVERLGPVPADLRPIEGTQPRRFELRLGELHEWLDESDWLFENPPYSWSPPRQFPTMTTARQLLAPLLLDEDAALWEVRSRRRR